MEKTTVTTQDLTTDLATPEFVLVNVNHLKTFTFTPPPQIPVFGAGVSNEKAIYFDLNYLPDKFKYVLSSSNRFIYFKIFEAGSEEEAISIAQDILVSYSATIIRKLLDQ